MRKFTVSILFVIINLFSFSQQTSVQQQQQQQVEVEVSADELELFIGALELVQEINQKAQQKMVQVIENNDFTVEEFNQVQQKLQKSQDAEVEEDNKIKFDKIVEGVEEIQIESQQQMQESIKEIGLTVQRYQQILLGVQSDEDLYARFQEIAGLN
ncbi:MAG: DUF4168 domain-containing protein [Bacteroidales bacterium]|nr:DUF4168 domain-containing protein [Bacteroidales bacterium]